MRRPVPRFHLPRVFLALLLLVPALLVPISAQVAGRNVNMVSGGTFPGGDPFKQKQNEPSIAISTRNPCHLLAGANDYRAVNLPGLPDDQEIGDSWVGQYESTDCGATFYSTLVPGFPQDTSPEGLASPAKGHTTAADPVLKAGSAGTLYYLFIAFNRGTNFGKLVLARYIDHNDREVFIDPDRTPSVADRQARSAIKYVGTSEIAKGSGGRFVDKPSLAVFPATTGTCTMDGETVPATNVYVAWSEFIGNNPDNQKSKIMFARSNNCGLSLAGPATKLSEGFPLGSGTTVAVNPTNPSDIYVVWRQIRNSKEGDAILFARSTDGGNSFTKAQFVPGLGVGRYAPFDQNTTSPAIGSATQTFRTVGFPAVAFADDGFMYLAVSQVPSGPTGTLGGANARITLTRTNGTTWEPPTAVVDTGGAGQQFMPALAYAAGKLQLVWYDVRFDESLGPNALITAPLIDEVKAIADAQRRRTIDLLGAQASLPSSVWPPVFQYYGVSQPDYNDPASPNGPPLMRGPRIAQYPIGDRDPQTSNGGARQLQFNRANLLLHGGGTIPFMGDYIDNAPIPFIPDGTGKWLFNGIANAGNTALSTFQAAWTDNRDARVGNATTTPTGALSYVSPKILPANATIGDVQCPADAAGNPVDNTLTRDSNVYTSRITQDFSLTLPGNAKPTNTPGVVRTFAVQLANNGEFTPGTATPETPTLFKLTIANAPTSSSFSRQTFLGFPQVAVGCALATGQTPLQEIFVNLLPRSSAVRTVYVSCGLSPATRVVVTATRMIDPNTPSAASASVIINPDPFNQPAKGPDGGPLGPETHTPDAENPDAENPDAENPDAENPDAENPDAENPDAENPDAENPDAENPDAENPDAENPDAENPDAENANPQDVQDVSADVTNDGGTTSGYQVQAQTGSLPGAGYSFLLMARRVYATPTSINCHLVNEYRNQTLFSIPLSREDLVNQPFFDENDPNPKHPTIIVRPGESIRVTLRIVRDTVVAPEPFCSADPESPEYCFNKIVIKTQAQAPNTGETEPEEDSVGTLPGPDLTVTDGPVVATPTVAGIGGFVDLDPLTIQNTGNETAEEFTWITYIRSAVTGLIGVGIFDSLALEDGEELPTGPIRLHIPFTYFSGEAAAALPPGDYFAGVLADSGLDVDETDEDNNTLESIAPISVVGYETTINVSDGSVATGVPFPVSVVVTTNGVSPDSIEGATVTLALEGPGPQDNVPGPPAPMTTSPLSDTTDAEGVASFLATVNLPAGFVSAQYRIVATVTIPAGPTLKFQSSNFTVSVPEP